jgi:acyl-[acyl-carrier-protein]-phospholipid O-acyltransferase/long-chain-fatty-acid--[acyl-carrier-protein] ligase
MGFTVCLWAVLSLDVKGAYHFSPLEAKVIGKLCREHRVTIMITTPTFLRSYMRRCAPEEFASLSLVVTGAEKLPGDLLEAFEEKFGIRPMEGYGTTELSPIVSLNVPPNRGARGLERVGTVGKPIPGVSAKVIDLESGQDLPIGESGLLLIKGPNVMQGYFKMPEQTAKVLRDGWYSTGDMGMLDEDGLIHITGRLSRFSKIGGEMVPHSHIEEILQRILASCDEEDDKPVVAVTAVPDQRKGERLIVLHLPAEKTPDVIVKQLAAEGLPNLWIPSADSFFEVQQIPLLGTGKLDLQSIKELAQEKLGIISAG